jgi:hypothetical protein
MGYIRKDEDDIPRAKPSGLWTGHPRIIGAQSISWKGSGLYNIYEITREINQGLVHFTHGDLRHVKQ